jgi:hypothetical protein
MLQHTISPVYEYIRIQNNKHEKSNFLFGYD